MTQQKNDDLRNLIPHHVSEVKFELATRKEDILPDENRGVLLLEDNNSKEVFLPKGRGSARQIQSRMKSWVLARLHTGTKVFTFSIEEKTLTVRPPSERFNKFLVSN